MSPVAAIVMFLAPGSILAADGWDETDAKKTLEWLAKTAPDKSAPEVKTKEFFKSLVGKKVAWPIVVRMVHKAGYVRYFDPAWPQADGDEVWQKWRDQKSEDLRDAAMFTFKSAKKIPLQNDHKEATDDGVFAPTDAPWARKQTRGDPAVLTGTLVKIELAPLYIVPLNLPDQKKKTLYRFIVIIDGKIGPKE